MAYSYDVYAGNGSTKVFAITFNYITSTVTVGADPKGIEVHLADIKQTSGYSINTSTHQVTFTTAPDVEIKILRKTPRGKADRLVDFADATVLTEAQLDTSALQLLYIAQEAFEQSTSGGGGAPVYLPYDSNNQWWDAVYGGSARSIKNVETPLADDAAANKKYVDDVAEWGISGVPQAFKFVGDATATTFQLLTAPYVEAEMLVVSIDGLLQIPTEDFDVEGGAVNSTLSFVSGPPATGTEINVQNFGKMRFLDGINLTDGSVTTAKLDQTATTEAVSTATIRDDAVTAAKIADTSVDLARINTTAFTTSTAATTPRFLSVPVSGVTLGLDTLKTADIENFTTNVRSGSSVNHFGPATGVWSNGDHKINSLGAPTSGTDAANKTYVDDAISAASFANSGWEFIATHQNSSATTDYWTIQGWFDDAKYRSYRIDCTGFGCATNDRAVAIASYITGQWRAGAGEVRTYSRCDPLQAEGGASDGLYGLNYVSFATPVMPRGGLLEDDHNLTITLENNNSSWARYKQIVSQGHGETTQSVVGGGTSAPGRPDDIDDGIYEYRIVNEVRTNTDTVQGLSFRAVDDGRTTSNHGYLKQWMQIHIYGRKY